MPDDKQVDKALAEKIASYLDGHEQPSHETVGSIAEAVGASEADVTRVLDEWRRDENGRLSHHGAGAGGGWIT